MAYQYAVFDDHTQGLLRMGMETDCLQFEIGGTVPHQPYSGMERKVSGICTIS